MNHFSDDFTVQKTGDYVLSYMNKCKVTKFDFQICYPTYLITLMNILAYWSRWERSGPIFPLGWALLQIDFWPYNYHNFSRIRDTTFSLTQCVKNQPLLLTTSLGVPWCVSFIIFTFKKAVFTLRQLASFHVLTVIAVDIQNVQLFYQYPRGGNFSVFKP